MLTPRPSHDPHATPRGQPLISVNKSRCVDRRGLRGCRPTSAGSSRTAGGHCGLRRRGAAVLPLPVDGFYPFRRRPHQGRRARRDHPRPDRPRGAARASRVAGGADGAESHPAWADIVTAAAHGPLPILSVPNEIMPDMSDHQAFRLAGRPFLFVSAARVRTTTVQVGQTVRGRIARLA